MEPLKELDLFKRLLESSSNELIDKALSEGRVAIGYNCCMVPIPLLSVGKFFPVHLRAPEAETTENADYFMSSFNCSYSRSILENALANRYEWLGGLAFAASCIHTQRTEHNMKLQGINENKPGWFSYMIDTPRKSFDASLIALAADLRTLAGTMARAYEVEISDADVAAAIKDYNDFNALLQKLSDLRKSPTPRITGTEFATVMDAVQVAPRDMLVKPIKALIKACEKRDPLEVKGPRIMVMGARIDNPAFIQLIEDAGCYVAADRFCFGSLPGLEPIEQTGDPFMDLARHFMEKSDCPRMMMETDKRMDHTFTWYEEFGCDGILLEVMKFCDLWGWEVVKVRNEAEDRGIPVVKIEREYQLTGEGQLQTRVQAFIESLNARAVASADKGQS